MEGDLTLWLRIKRMFKKPDAITVTTATDSDLDQATHPVDRGEPHAGKDNRDRKFTFLNITYKF
jgi:hypothetical protein